MGNDSAANSETGAKSTPVTKPPRRTQRERREGTIAKLVDATTRALGEVGYAKTSVQAICDRAQLSHGALFRHFATRLELIALTGETVARQRAEAVAAAVAGVPAGTDPADAAVSVLRAQAGAPLAIVWGELVAAARSEPVLQERLGPASDALDAATAAALAQLPGAERLDADRLGALAQGLSRLFEATEAVTALGATSAGTDALAAAAAAALRG